MTADAQDTLASIRVPDSKYCVAVGARHTWVNMVDNGTRSLKICEFPTCEACHRVCAAPCRYACARAAFKRLPRPAPRNGTGPPAARRGHEGSRAREFYLQPARWQCTSVSSRGIGHTACSESREVGVRGRKNHVDNIPAHMLSLSLDNSDTKHRHYQYSQ